MSWFSSAASKRTGTCQSTMTALNETRAVHGLATKRPTARSGCEKRPSSAARIRRRRAPTGQAVEQRQPRGSGHDEDRGEEGDEDVLDHVDEEVVVRPVVDGRHHGEQEQRQPAVEEQASAAVATGCGAGTGASTQVGQATLVEQHDDGHDDHERVEAPVVDQVIHAARPSVAGIRRHGSPRGPRSAPTSRRPRGTGWTGLADPPVPDGRQRENVQRVTLRR